jgi:hypothetical protein
MSVTEQNITDLITRAKKAWRSMQSGRRRTSPQCWGELEDVIDELRADVAGATYI